MVIYEDPPLSDAQVYPEKGTVAFSAGVHGTWVDVFVWPLLRGYMGTWVDFYHD